MLRLPSVPEKTEKNSEQGANKGASLLNTQLMLIILDRFHACVVPREVAIPPIQPKVLSEGLSEAQPSLIDDTELI